MSLDALRETLPAYAKDLSLNLSSLAAETLLTDQQKWGAFVASAYAVGQPAVVKAVEAGVVVGEGGERRDVVLGDVVPTAVAEVPAGHTRVP